MPRPTVAPVRRTQIVDAVVEILSTEGWDGLTLRRISEVSGLSNGAMSHFAGRKGEMVAEATRRHFKQYIERTEAVMEGGAPYERLEKWIHDIVAPGEENEREWACWLALWGRAPFDPLIQEELAQVYGTHSSRLAEIIREGIAGGQFAPCDPEHVADETVALIDGLAMRRIVDPESVPPERVRSIAQRHLDAALRPQTD